MKMHMKMGLQENLKSAKLKNTKTSSLRSTSIKCKNVMLELAHSTKKWNEQNMNEMRIQNIEFRICTSFLLIEMLGSPRHLKTQPGHLLVVHGFCIAILYKKIAWSQCSLAACKLPSAIIRNFLGTSKSSFQDLLKTITFISNDFNKNLAFLQAHQSFTTLLSLGSNVFNYQSWSSIATHFNFALSFFTLCKHRSITLFDISLDFRGFL